MQHNAEPAIGLLETIFASPGLTTALASLAGILLTALIGLSLRIREERAKRGVRSADLFSSAYHEIAISFATVSGMAQHLQLDIFLEEIKRNNKYFPHWPAYTSMLFVFENEIKKETLALPVYLKPYLYDFYQNSIYYSQLLTDLRSDVVKKMSPCRRMRMLDNFYFSAYQTAISGCIACIKCELALCPLNKVFPDTETYAALEKIFPLNYTSRNLSDLKWAINRFGFAVPVGSADIIRRRNKVYWKILKALKTEQKKCQTITDQALAFLLANGIPDEDI